MVEGGGLENRWAATLRGFESYPFRHCLSKGVQPNRCYHFDGRHGEVLKLGRRGAPAKGVGRETGARVRIPPSPPNKPTTETLWACFLRYKIMISLSVRREYLGRAGRGCSLFQTTDKSSPRCKTALHRGLCEKGVSIGGKKSVSYFAVTWFLICPVGSSRIKSLDLPARNR